jgi:hypothetical protein
MKKMNAHVFMNWFRQITDNETIEFKLIALKEFKQMIKESTGDSIYFVNNREITISDEDVVTNNF